MRVSSGMIFEKTDDGMVRAVHHSGSATGKDPRDAMKNFNEQVVTKRLQEYKKIDLDKKLTIPELTEIFQFVVFGKAGCAKGVEAFIKREDEAHEIAKRDGFSVRQLLDLLTEEHGAATFKQFFDAL